MRFDTLGYMKAYLNRGVYFKLQSFPYTARILHAAPGGFPSHVSTGLALSFLRHAYPRGGGRFCYWNGSVPFCLSIPVLRAFFEILRISQHSIYEFNSNSSNVSFFLICSNSW